MQSHAGWQKSSEHLAQVGIPEEVLEEATRIAHAVQEEESREPRLGASVRHHQLEAIYSLAHKVKCVGRARISAPEGFSAAQQLAALKREAKKLFPGSRAE